MQPAEEQFLRALKVEAEEPEKEKLVYARVTINGPEWMD